MSKLSWAALFLAMSMAAPLSSFAAGAIAVDVDDGRGEMDPGYGFISGEASRESAGKAALAECKKHGHKSCKVLVNFDQCGAYAASIKYFGSGWGKSRKEAEMMALDKCGNNRCQVRIANCE